MGYLFVFLDGVGLGSTTPANPLALPTTMPFVATLLGGAWLQGLQVQRDRLCCHGIDARLGVPGLPQSATGQTTLYTGQNAAAFRGRHQSAFAGGSLRQLINRHGMFQQVLARGGRVAHANAYLPSYWQQLSQRRRRYSVGTLLSLTAGLPFRGLDEYQRGEAVYWDITGAIVEQVHGIATISPAEAGQRLLSLGQTHDLTLFECYLPDYAGHQHEPQSRWQAAIAALQRVDALLAALITQLPSSVTLIVSSDHGNVEDLSHKTHTLNPVPLLVVGAEAEKFHQVQDLTGLAPRLV